MSEAVGWILLPTLFALFVYSATVLCVWPYARGRVSLFPLLLLILFPPLFPGLLFYLVFLWALTPQTVLVQPAKPVRSVVVVDRGRVRVTTRPAGSRV